VRSGLSEALEILDGVEGIGIIHMNKEDIVRHRLVTRIVEAYDKRKTENGNLKTANEIQES
jgi:phosphate starvation-inducible PhoH-like protein